MMILVLEVMNGRQAIMNNTIFLYDDTLKLELPDSFVKYVKEDVQKCFQGDAPDFVYGIEDRKTIVSITKTNIDIKAEDFDTRLQEYYTLYSRNVPSFSAGKLVKKELNDGNEIGAFQYISTSAERDLLNFFVLLPLNKKECIITMHCSIEDGFYYGLTFMHILNSIEAFS